MTHPLSLLSHLECGSCLKTYDATKPMGLCDCGKPLLARYDLASVNSATWLSEVKSRDPNLWRYAELLPVQSRPLTLGEGFTPLIDAKAEDGSVWFKWEGANPTGSFKDRGMSVAVSRAMELGLSQFVVPTAGNAGVAAAAYVKAGGGTLDVFMPSDSDQLFFDAVTREGARLHKIDGLISDCGAAAQDLIDRGSFNLSTLKEPYRIEGKKTMGYELWEQMDGILPDMIIYPTGGGTGLIGMWKAFSELEELGLLKGPKPKMVSVQMEGCAPMVRAFKDKTTYARAWDSAKTDVLGLRVPSAVGDFLILRAIKDSGGTALSVSEHEAFSGVTALNEGYSLDASPEAGAAFAAMTRLKSEGLLRPTDRVVVFLTGSGVLYRSILARHGVVADAALLESFQG